MGVRGTVQRRPVTAFVVLVLALSWPMLLLAQGLPFGVGLPLGLLGPATCAFLVTWLSDGRAGARELGARVVRWRVPVRWYLVAVFGMSALVWVAAYGVAAVAVPAALVPPPLGQLLVVPVNFVVIFLVTGLVEETGWRGFLLPRLGAKLTPLIASLVVGAVWWTWHLPIRFTYAGPDALALSVHFAVGIVADAVIYTWFFHRVGGSVLLVALMHAASNTWGGHLYWQTFIADPVLFNAVRFGVYVLVAIVLVVVTRGRLGAPAGSPTSGTLVGEDPTGR